MVEQQFVGSESNHHDRPADFACRFLCRNRMAPHLVHLIRSREGRKLVGDVLGLEDDGVTDLAGQTLERETAVAERGAQRLDPAVIQACGDDDRLTVPADEAQSEAGVGKS